MAKELLYQGRKQMRKNINVLIQELCFSLKTDSKWSVYKEGNVALTSAHCLGVKPSLCYFISISNIAILPLKITSITDRKLFVC